MELIPMVVEKTGSGEGFIKMVYELLKDKLNIVKITFTSGVNVATAEFPSRMTIDRCPWCDIALKDGVFPKCGYRLPEGE